MSTATLSARTASPATWVRAGLISGVIGGIVFAMFEMIAAAVLNGPDAFFVPLRMIGAIAIGKSALDPSSSLLAAGSAGLLVHTGLSMLYGLTVAGIIAAVPALSRSAATVVAAASVAGLALWIANFFVLAGAFGWNWFPDNQNPAVQLIAHTIMFGAVLGLSLEGLAFRGSR